MQQQPTFTPSPKGRCGLYTWWHVGPSAYEIRDHDDKVVDTARDISVACAKAIRWSGDAR